MVTCFFIDMVFSLTADGGFMANVFSSLSVELLDELGVTTSMDLFYQAVDTVTLADLNSFAAAVLPDLDAITGSQIMKATYKVGLTLPGSLKSSPAAGSKNEQTGLFQMAQATVPYTDGVDVPGLSDTLIANGKIDLTASAITDWISDLTTTIQSQIPISKFRYALTALRSALISFRKHRKAESRISREIP
jgi:hypothetical protein